MQHEPIEPLYQIMLARYYAAGVGRFLSTDPASGSARTSVPQTWNRFGYARNNPLLRIDRDGMVEASFLDEFRKQGNWASVPPTPASVVKELRDKVESGAQKIGKMAGTATLGLLAATAVQPELGPGTLPAAGVTATVATVAHGVAFVVNPASSTNAAALGADMLGAAAGAAATVSIKAVAPKATGAAVEGVVAATEEVVGAAAEPAIEQTLEQVSGPASTPAPPPSNTLTPKKE
jgi:RHS repeat-associated protein